MASFFQNAAWGGFSAMVRTAAGVLIALFAARLLGGERYGHVATFLSIFALYLAMNSSVFTVLVTKLTGVCWVEDVTRILPDLSSASALVFSSLVILGLLTVLVWATFPGVFPSGSLDNPLMHEIQRSVLLMGTLAALQILSGFNAALLEGAGRLDLAMKWQLFGPLLIAGGLASLFVTRIPVTASGYVGVLCLGALTDLLLLSLARRRLLPVSLGAILGHAQRARIWTLLKSGATLQAASVMGLFLEPLNKFLLNHFSGPLAVTAYDLAMKLIWGIQSLFGAAMRVFLHLSGQPGQMVARTFSRVLAFVLVPVLATHVAAAIFLTWLVHQWVPMGDPLRVMVFFAIATVSNLGMIYVTPLYVSLTSRGDLRFILHSQAIVAMTNIVASLTLVPFFGLLGAVFGLLCATLYNVAVIFRRHERLIGRHDDVLPILRAHAGRFLVVVLLFAAAIALGAERTVNYVAEAALLLSVAAVMWNEPMVKVLYVRLRGSRQ